MRITQITENSFTLKLPKKQRILGVILLIVGLIIPILLYFLNNYQTSLSDSGGLKALIQDLSLGSFLGGFLSLELLFILYFFTIHNNFTALGHIALIILNSIAFIATYSSVYILSPILLTGLYLLTHFKSINCEKVTARFSLSERIFLIFHSQISVPFNEIQKFSLEHREYFGFFRRSKTAHRFKIILYLFEKDPGFENDLNTLENEKTSLEFFRPQTLRKTLISKPILINSSLLNLSDHDSIQMKRLVELIVSFMDFSLAEEKVLGKKKVAEFKRRVR